MLQSQVTDLKSKLESGGYFHDRFIGVRFQISFEELRCHISWLYSKNIRVTEFEFTATVDFAKRELTDDNLESTS
jgi:hypothetical protein